MDMQEIIAQAYQLFKDYRPHHPLTICHRENCCISNEDRSLIYATPLPDLRFDVLREYLSAAAGDGQAEMSDELRYFIPRIWQMMAAGEDLTYLGDEYALERCALQLGIWQPEEVALFEKFALEYFKQFAQKNGIWFSLELFYKAGLRNMPDLLIWLRSALSQPKILQTFLTEIWYYFDYYTNAAENESGLEEVLSAWLNEPATKEVLMPLLFTDLDDAAASGAEFLFLYYNESTS